MRKPYLFRNLWIFLLVLLGAGLACNLPVGGQTAPTERIPVSTEAVEDLQEELEAAAQSIQNEGVVEITLTEEQLTSLAALKLESEPNSMIRDPQIFLRAGQIEVRGDVDQNGMLLPFELILSVSVDSAGQPDYQVQSAQVGPLPLPEEMITEIESQVDHIFAAELRSQTAGVVIDDIIIADGTMIITGHRQ